MQENSKGISGHVLKLIAIVTMLIDHIGAVVVERMLQPGDIVKLFPFEGTKLGFLYFVLRVIGRMAFPIFCWLLVEGYLHTSDKKKYGIRLAVFALISEIPFNLAHQGLIDLKHQNVFFTLLMGYLAICLWELTLDKIEGTKGAIIAIAEVFAIAFLAEFLNTDYGMAGIVCMMVMYRQKENRLLAFGLGVAILGLISSSLEFFALLMLIPMYFYDGTRGKQNKYFFYIFYPAHLLVLYLIARVFIS